MLSTISRNARRAAAPLLQRWISNLRVSVVGSGPAGFYTAKTILRTVPTATIHMFERMPVPYGLIRFGVAPDHPEVKVAVNVTASMMLTYVQQAQEAFEQIARTPNFAFFGNVQVGSDVTLEDLKAAYHVVVLATGAPGEKRLGIPGV